MVPGTRPDSTFSPILFPVLTRAFPGTGLDFYLPGILPDPPFLVLARILPFPVLTRILTSLILARIPPFSVLTQISTFLVFSRIPHFRYSPGSYLLRYSPGFYLFRYSLGSHLSRYSPRPFSGTCPDFYFSGTRTDFHLSGTSLDSTFLALALILPFPDTRPDFSMVLAQISTFPELAQILPFPVLA